MSDNLGIQQNLDDDEDATDFHSPPEWWFISQGSQRRSATCVKTGRRVYDDVEWPRTGINDLDDLKAYVKAALDIVEGLRRYADVNSVIGLEHGKRAVDNVRSWLFNHEFRGFPADPRSVSELDRASVESLLRAIIIWIEDECENHTTGGGPRRATELVGNHKLRTKPATTKEPEETPGIVLTTSWSDLAIGIDEDGSFLAVSSVPEFTSVFPKESAVQLPLKGKRWKELLKLLAESSDGRNAAKKDLLVNLGYLSKVIDEEQIDDVQHDHGRMNEIKKANMSLTQAIGDLSRQLRTHVSASDDEKRRSPPLSVGERNVVRSAFTCRFLCRDGNGKLRFGEAN